MSEGRKREEHSKKVFSIAWARVKYSLRTNNMEEGKQNLRMRKVNHEHKLAVIGFTISIVFMLSFVPFIIVNSIVKATGTDPEQLQGVHLVFHSMFVRSFFLNVFANPIIYGVLNKKFRDSAINLITRKERIS